MIEPSQKLPWTLRWSLLKHALKGQLPAKWEEWGKTYLVTQESPEILEKERELKLKEQEKAWMERIAENNESKTWSKADQVQLYWDYLRLIWMDEAPTALVKNIARQWWLAKPTPKRLGRSMMEWTLFYSSQTDMSYSVDTLTEKERTWLLGWAIAIREPARVLEVYNPQTDLKLDGHLPLISWMAIFDAHEAIQIMLDHHPKQVFASADFTAMVNSIQKLEKKYETPHFHYYFAKNWDPVYFANEWDSTESLKELCYRGGPINCTSTDHHLTSLWRAVENTDIEHCEILVSHGAYGFNISETQAGPLNRVVNIFQPGLDDGTKNRWLSMFKAMLQNPIPNGWQEYVTPEEENQIVNLAFRAMEKEREPKLLTVLYEELDKRNIHYNWVWTTSDPKNPDNETKKQTLFDIALQSKNPDYMMILAGHGFNLNQKRLYQLALLQPGALGVWLDTASSTDLQNWVHQPTPNPMTELEVNSTSRNNSNWKKKWTFWYTAMAGEDAVEAYTAILKNATLEAMLTPDILMDLMQRSWHFQGETCLAFQKLMKDKFKSLQAPTIQSNQPFEIINFSRLLDKSNRSLHAIDALVRENLVPWTWPTNQEGDVLTHLVIQNQDQAFFDILVKYGVDFEIPNLKGETAMNLAMKNNPSWYRILVKHQQERLQKNLSDANSTTPSKSHRL